MKWINNVIFNIRRSTIVYVMEYVIMFLMFVTVEIIVGVVGYVFNGRGWDWMRGCYLGESTYLVYYT